MIAGASGAPHDVLLAVDPADVTAGGVGFAVIAGLAIGTALLLRSLNKQLKKVDFDEGPETDGPATGDAATDGPATGDAATDGPATDGPATGDAATDGPATDGPATGDAITDRAGDEPVRDGSAGDEPDEGPRSPAS